MENSSQQLEIVKNERATNTGLCIRSPYGGKGVVTDYAGIERFQEALARAHIDYPDNCREWVEPEPVSFFCKDLHARWLEIPAGMLIVSRIHKFEHMFMLASGKATVIDFKESRDLEGPFMEISPAGAQRIFHAITDCVACTFHPNVKEEENMKDALSSATGKDHLNFLKASGTLALGAE